jgi:hypothetical protein
VGEIERRASEAKCPLPAEEGWVMEKKKGKVKVKGKLKNQGMGRYVKKPMAGGEPWV